MRRILTLWPFIFLVFYSPSIYSQINVELNAQYCTFNMEDLKALQDQLLQDPLLPMKKVNSFPNYYGVRGSATYVFENMKYDVELGGIFMFTSTGGRVQYKDYSGSLTADQLTKAVTLGIVGKITILRKSRFKFGASNAIGVDLTKLDLTYSLRVGQSLSRDAYSFKATGASIIPSFFVKYSPTQKIFVIIDLGAKMAVYQETYKWSNDNTSELYLDGSNDPLKPNWNGLRAGIGIGYCL